MVRSSFVALSCARFVVLQNLWGAGFRVLLRAGLVAAALALTACGGGGGGSSSSSSSSSGGGDASEVSSVQVTGAGVGPLTGADVHIYAFDNLQPGLQGTEPLASGRTDETAAFTDLQLPEGLAPEKFPLLLEVVANADTLDHSTGSAPQLTALRTVITEEQYARMAEGKPVYATPLTTLAVALAAEISGSGPDSAYFLRQLDIAAEFVKSVFGFGLLSSDVDIFRTPPLLNKSTTTLNAQSRVAAHRTAIESLLAVVDLLKNEILAARPNSTITSDDVLLSLALDLFDGTIDGSQGDRPIVAFSAVPNVGVIVQRDPLTLVVPGTNVSLGSIEQMLVNEAGTTCGCSDISLVTRFLVDGTIDLQPQSSPLAVPPQVIVNIGDEAEEKPRVEGAFSSGNNTVRVSFSKPMSGSALLAANYDIRESADSRGVSRLHVQAVRFAEDSLDEVILTVEPQQELLYRLTVINVKSVDGLSLDISTGDDGFIYANYALFLGTAPSQRLACSASSGQNLAGRFCSTDSDCWPADAGSGAGSCDVVLGDNFLDSDGDGISDDKELRGYLVRIFPSNGVEEERAVTSDPYSADTDGDGIDDYTELSFGSNPRDPDTDNDGLSDELELNFLYSSAYRADTDGDTLEDGWEYKDLGTSPIHADTDGDQLDDAVELFERYRDPLIADLPLLRVEPGNAFISLNEIFTYTDSNGTEQALESSSTAQVGTTSSQGSASFDENVVETIIENDISVGISGGVSDSVDVPDPLQVSPLSYVLARLFVQGEFGWNHHWGTNTVSSNGSSTEIALESQRVLEDSYAKADTISSASEVTREVQSATLNVEVFLRNVGDMAFSATDVELSVLRVRPGTRKLEPIATLLPQSGANPVYQLGPFNEVIGPLVFSAVELPPAVAEELMRDPAGLVFKVANYTISDEYGRFFSYIDQEVADKTAGLVVDYGFEDAVRQQVAVAAMRDPASGAPIGAFDASGKPAGLPLSFLLENRLGMQRDPVGNDAVTAGQDGDVDTVAVGDDVQVFTVGTRGLGPDDVVISAGPNGRLDTAVAVGGDPNINGDLPVVTRGFSTSQTCGVNSPAIFKSIKACSADAECTCTAENGCPAVLVAEGDAYADAVCDGPRIITRVGSYRNRDGSYRWIALTDADLTTSSDIDRVIMKPGETFKLAFVADRDQDGVFSRIEYIEGSVDSPLNQEDNILFGDTYRADGAEPGCEGQVLPDFCNSEYEPGVRLVPLADSRDTDRDGIDDPVEINLGWEVAPNGQPRRKVYPSPVLRDSDGDGLSDWQERDIRFSCNQTFAYAGENRRADYDYVGLGQLSPFPQFALTFSSYTIVGYPGAYQNAGFVTPFDGPPAAVPNPGPADEISLAPGYTDTSALTYYQYVAPFCEPDYVDPYDPAQSVVNRASLDPTSTDTDGDGVEDGAELLGYDVREAMVLRLSYEQAVLDSKNPNGGIAFGGAVAVKDMDDNPPLFAAQGDDVLVREWSKTLSQGAVIILPGANQRLDSDYQQFVLPTSGSPYLQKRAATRIRSNPLQRDTDGDLLSDGAELALGTNPIDPGDAQGFRDSDSDGVFDDDEARGLLIRVNGAELRVYSNPTRPDSDGDGLPDFVEYQIGSNPANQDTDGDGLRDYDEFSAAQFAMYAFYVDRFENFSLDGSISKKYGSDLNKSDTDGDGLTDAEEVNGFWVALQVNGVPVSEFVTTNPLYADTDGDGLTDGVELQRIGSQPMMTHPTLRDTDGDGTTDGVELSQLSAGRDPLQTDMAVTVRYNTLILTGGTNQNPAWSWQFFIDYPGADTSCPAIENPDVAYLPAGQTGSIIPINGFDPDFGLHESYSCLLPGELVSTHVDYFFSKYGQDMNGATIKREAEDAWGLGTWTVPTWDTANEKLLGAHTFAVYDQAPYDGNWDMFEWDPPVMSGYLLQLREYWVIDFGRLPNPRFNVEKTFVLKPGQQFALSGLIALADPRGPTLGGVNTAPLLCLEDFNEVYDYWDLNAQDQNISNEVVRQGTNCSSKVRYSIEVH